MEVLTPKFVKLKADILGTAKAYRHLVECQTQIFEFEIDAHGPMLSAALDLMELLRKRQHELNEQLQECGECASK